MRWLFVAGSGIAELPFGSTFANALEIKLIKWRVEIVQRKYNKTSPLDFLVVSSLSGLLPYLSLQSVCGLLSWLIDNS